MKIIIIIVISYQLYSTAMIIIGNHSIVILIVFKAHYILFNIIYIIKN